MFDSLINNFINPRDGGVAAPATAARALELRARKKHVPAATLLQPVHGRTRARRARGQQTEVRVHVNDSTTTTTDTYVDGIVLEILSVGLDVEQMFYFERTGSSAGREGAVRAN